MKPITFKLDGKPLVFNSLSPLAQKIKAFLDKQANDDLFRAHSLAEAVKSTAVSVTSTFSKAGGELAAYTATLTRPTHAKIFGNPKAIAEFKRGMESQ